MAVVGRLQWKKVPVYWLAQYIGAFLGAACIYLVYYGPLLLLLLNLNNVELLLFAARKQCVWATIAVAVWLSVCHVNLLCPND